MRTKMALEVCEVEHPTEVNELRMQEGCVKQAAASEIKELRMQEESAVAAIKQAQTSEIMGLQANLESAVAEAGHLAEKHTLRMEAEGAKFETLKYELAAAAQKTDKEEEED